MDIAHLPSSKPTALDDSGVRFATQPIEDLLQSSVGIKKFLAEQEKLSQFFRSVVESPFQRQVNEWNCIQKNLADFAAIRFSDEIGRTLSGFSSIKLFANVSALNLSTVGLSATQNLLEPVTRIESVLKEQLRLGETVRLLSEGFASKLEPFAHLRNTIADWGLTASSLVLRESALYQMHLQSLFAEPLSRFCEPLAQIEISNGDQSPLYALELVEPEHPILERKEIIQVSGWAGVEMAKYFQQNPNALKEIDRRKFEEFVAELFRGFGYDVELTAQTKDGGKDVIAIKRREVNVKYLIECKRPDPGNPVSVAQVRALLGVKTDEGASKAILATTTHFSPASKRLFARHQWELEPRDFFGIQEWIHDYLSAKKQG